MDFILFRGDLPQSSLQKESNHFLSRSNVSQTDAIAMVHLHGQQHRQHIYISRRGSLRSSRSAPTKDTGTKHPLLKIIECLVTSPTDDGQTHPGIDVRWVVRV